MFIGRRERGEIKEMEATNRERERETEKREERRVVESTLATLSRAHVTTALN